MLILISCQKKEDTPSPSSTAHQLDQQDLENDMPGYKEDVSSEDSHSLYPLKPGPFPFINNGGLGPPKVFWNEMDEDTTCYMLSIDGQEVEWIYSAYRSPSTLILFKCYRIEGDASEFGMPDAFLGGTDQLFYEAGKEGNTWKLSAIDIPGYSAFSGGNICGDMLAYWGSEGNNWNVSVFDLKNRKLLKKNDIGKYDLGTDYILFYPTPKWKKDCSSVLFPEHIYMKKPVMILLENDE